MGRLLPSIPPALAANPEFQAALVRIGIWTFALCYIGIGAWSEQFLIDYTMYADLFAIFLVLNIAILISVLRRPLWEARRYAAPGSDILAVTFAIYLVQDAGSPFYAVYILIFISAGTRYGLKHLAAASVAALVCYNVVLAVLGGWELDPVNSFFRVLILMVLPPYQATLLRKLHQAREDALAAKEVAEDASRAKGQFLARMSHELRTPLTGVRGNADLLLTTPMDAEQREYVDTIIASSNTLQALIGDILDLSKIEAGKLRLEDAPFDPRAILREVCQVLHPLALAKGIELICDSEDDVPTAVQGDALRVRQILFNLIGNAVKFTEQGEVCVAVSLVEPGDGLAYPQLLIAVTDTGIGIDTDKLEAIFESFAQADESTTRRYGGTGLGTTIARDLAILMGGRIDVASTPGEGTCFRVRLPLRGAGASAPGAASALAVPAPSDSDLSGCTVLICELSPNLRRILVETCSRLGAHCLIATAPEQVSGVIRAAGRIDFAILGDSPPGIGLPLLVAALREQLGFEPSTLCLTYRQRRAQLTQVHRRCLNKPFLREDLIRAIALARTPEAADAGPCCLPVAARAAPATPALTRDGAEAAAGLRVLVAEDSPIPARVIVLMMEKLGAAVTLVGNGADALTAARAGGFAMAFVDLHMPGLDGLGFARALREHERVSGTHLPVYALTANACEDVRQQCLRVGMDGFLSKPVEPEALRETLIRHGQTGGQASAGPAPDAPADRTAGLDATGAVGAP